MEGTDNMNNEEANKGRRRMEKRPVARTFRTTAEDDAYLVAIADQHGITPCEYMHLLLAEDRERKRLYVERLSRVVGVAPVKQCTQGGPNE